MATTRTRSPRPRPRSVRALGAIGLGVLCVSQFVDVLSVNTAVVALADIRGDLGMGASGAQWVISIYALLFGALLLPAGRLADRVGHRRLFIVGLVGFGAASLLCGAAPSGAVLVGARAATGVAAALTVPAALALLVAGTDEARRPRALGWWTAAGAGGGIAGLALGGIITDVAGWRAAFVAPAVLAFACLPFVATLGPSRPGDDRRPLDLRGTIAGVAGLVLLLAGLGAIGQGGEVMAAAALLLAAAAALAAFARIEARAPSPLLAPGFLADRRLAAGTLASAVNTAATGPFAVLGALYLQDVRGWSPAANGLSFVPFSVMVIVGSAVGAGLLGRLGPARTFALALVTLVTMPLVSCAITADGGEFVLIAARAIDGLGLGCAAVTATALGTSGAAEGARGFAAGLINTATQLGTALSIALLVPLAAAPDDAIAGLRLAFVATAAIAAAGGAAVLVVLRSAGPPPAR
ncbi:MAG TPA: MFS transporter [Solirubrobacteraceae bacterium]